VFVVPLLKVKLFYSVQDVNSTGPETLPVSVCNCFLYFTCKEFV